MLQPPPPAVTDNGFLTVILTDNPEDPPSSDAPTSNNTPPANTPPTLAFGLAAQDILTEGSTGLTLPLFNSVTFNTHQAGQHVDAIELSITNISNVGDEYISFDDTLVNLTNGAGLTANGFNYNILLDGSTAMITIGGFNAAGQAETLLNNLAYKNSASSYALGDRTFSLETISDSGGPELSQTNLSAIVTLNKPTVVNDFLMGSVGDDTFSFTAGEWSPADVIDGSFGHDTLKFLSNATIDLTSLPTATVNIEQIDLDGQYASIELDALAIHELTGLIDNTLFINGAASNDVTISDAGWNNITNGSTPAGYNHYAQTLNVQGTDFTIELYLDTDINPTGLA